MSLCLQRPSLVSELSRTAACHCLCWQARTFAEAAPVGWRQLKDVSALLVKPIKERTDLECWVLT
jgi:hypothetical protein